MRPAVKIPPKIPDVLLVGTPAEELEVLRRQPILRKLRIHAVADAGLAVAFMVQHAPYELAPRPDLIILDADLAQVENRGFLQHLKRSETLHAIPLVVLGDPGSDVLQAYRLGANCQLPRPRDAAGWETTLAALEQFWMKVATLPPR